MGRPVFKTFTLDELVTASHVIFVGAWENPKRRVDETTGAAYHCVRVLEVIDENPFIGRSMMSPAEFSPPPLPTPQVGDRLEILANRTRMLDVSNRSGLSSSGASFSARRYRTDQTFTDDDPLLFFVLCTSNGYEESADLALEPMARRADVEAAIALDRPKRDGRRRVASTSRLTHHR